MVSLDGRGKSPFLLAETDLWIRENRETREKENERRKKTFGSEFFSRNERGIFSHGNDFERGKDERKEYYGFE